MAQRMWSRARLLRWAKLLNIEVPPGTSDLRIYNQIMAAPPLEWQIAELREFLPTGMELPPDLTVGKAIPAIEGVRDIKNTRAIAAMGLEEGQIWRWYTKGHTSPYVYVWRVYTGQGHKVRLRVVELSRADGDSLATVRASDTYFTAHPYRMEVVARKVDLATWQPESFGPRPVEVALDIDLDDLPSEHKHPRIQRGCVHI